MSTWKLVHSLPSVRATKQIRRRSWRVVPLECPSRTFSRADYEYVGNAFESLGSVDGEVFSLREVLAQCAVDVLVRARLPSAGRSSSRRQCQWRW